MNFYLVFINTVSKFQYYATEMTFVKYKNNNNNNMYFTVLKVKL